MMVMLSHGLVSGALFLCVGVSLRSPPHPRDRRATAVLSDEHATLRDVLPAVHHGVTVGLPGTSRVRRRVPELWSAFTYRANSWAAFVVHDRYHSGCRLYSLYLYRRVAYGALTKRGRRGDARSLEARTVRCSYRCAAVVFWMGIYPESFLAPMRNDIGRRGRRGSCRPRIRAMRQPTAGQLAGRADRSVRRAYGGRAVMGYPLGIELWAHRFPKLILSTGGDPADAACRLEWRRWQHARA